MTEHPKPEVTPDDLHAYADGQLPPERRRAVEAWLAGNPEDAAAVAAWQAQNEAIRALYATPEAAAGDARMIRDLTTRRTRGQWRLAAAAAVLFALGGLAGALAARALVGSAQPVAQSLPEASRDSYLVYASEVRHPVEVGGDQEAHLVAWLGKRLGTPLAAPDLGTLGMHLVGGRLVPFGDAPGAMLMYEDTGGRRVTCLIARSDEGASTTAFRFAERDGISTFYWVEDGLGYALSGPLPREQLLAVANAVYGAT